MSTTAELNTLNWKHQAIPGFEYYDSQMDRHYIGQPDGTIRLKAQTGGGSIGSFTSVTANSLSPLFTVSVINPTTTADILFSQIPIGPNLVFAGPPGGGNANPTFRPLVLADLPGGGVAGSGTLNYIAKWTPDGFTLGDSNFIDDGINIALQGGKYITSQDTTKVQIDLGNLGGEYFQVTTDGGVGNQAYIFLHPAQASFGNGPGNDFTMLPSGNTLFKSTNFVSFSSPRVIIGGTTTNSISIGNVGSTVANIVIGKNTSDNTIVRSLLQYIDGNQASGYVLTSDASGNATWQAGGGSGASLTATYIGYGSGANALTGDSNLTWDSGNLVLLNKGTGIFGGVGGVYNYSMGSGVGTLGFNSFGYLAGVTGYGALMQLAPSTGTFSMFLESNVSAGNPHAHTTTLEWDNTGVVRIPVGLLLGTSTSGLGNAGFYGSTSGLVTIQPAAIAGTWTFTLPITGGTTGYFLQTDGSGTTTWANLATYTWMLDGNTVGSLKYIGTNDAFSFPIRINGGEVGRFLYSATATINGNLGINTTSPTAKVHIKGYDTDAARFGLKVDDATPTTNFYVRNDGAVSATNGYSIGPDLFLSKGTGGLDNIFIGITAGTSSGASAINNIAIGTNAFHANVTGINSIAIGYRALQASNSAAMDSNSIAIGKDSQILTSSGYQNTSMGTSALSTITTHYNNVAIGFWAGKNVIGVQNTFIGSLADASGSSPNVTNSIAIGNVAIVNDNNQLSIGSTTSPISEVRIGGGFGITSPQVINYYNTDVEAGNLNTISNADIIWNASRGTGTEVGADFVWKVAPGGASGTAQNPLVEAFRIKSTGAIGVLNITAIQTGNAGLSTGDLYVDSAANILANGDLILARKV